MADKEVLSQDEVKALLDGVDKGDVNTEGSAVGDDECKVIDFANQERVVRSQFPVIERIHERLSKKLTESIYDLMSREITVELGDLKILKFAEYMATLKMPTAINIMFFHPLRGKALIVMDSDLVFTIVENYFGGDGRYKSSIEEREFTLAEQRVTQIILGLISSDLKTAWNPIMELELELINTEMNPQLVNIITATDIILISTFEIKFEEGGGDLHIVLPYSMLEPIREQLDLSAARSDDDVDPNWIKSLKEEVMDAPLMLSSTLAATTINLRDVMNIKVGDVVPIEMPDVVSVEVEGIPTFTAKYGMSRDKCALKIVDRIKR